MSEFEKAMNRDDFLFSFDTVDCLNFEGKDENGYYSIAQKQNDLGDFAVFFFKDYERMKIWLCEWYGESFYEYLVGLYDEYLKSR